jgi:hypothetical protein
MDTYFKSEGHRLAFAINELDGQWRVKMLGLGLNHFTNKELAQNWRDGVLTLLKEHDMDDEITLKNLNKIYEEIIF